MYKMKSVEAIVFAMVVFGIGFIGCKGPVGPQGQEGPSLIYVLGGTDSPRGYDITYDVRVRVFNIPTVPTVKVNDKVLPHNWPEAYLEFVDEDFPICAGDSAELLVTYTKLNGGSGTALANVVVPGQFEITSHEPYSIVVIPAGTGMSLTWSPSDNADVYQSSFMLYYGYSDTHGNEKEFRYSLDTLITETSVTFPASELFPNIDEIDRIRWSGGSFWVWAMAGPWQEGTEGNVMGDGIGFFCASSYGGYIEIHVSGSKCLTIRNEGFENCLQRFLMDKVSRTDLFDGNLINVHKDSVFSTH